MESLAKYVPFVDLLLKTDRQKYFKFANIRKWILSKKTYPSRDISKIEQAIVTQYKNLLLENKVQIPQNVTDIFAPMIDLCSDDEEDDSENKKENTIGTSEENKCTQTKREQPSPKLDDDLEIVNYIDNVDEHIKKRTSNSNTKTKEELDLDEASKNILREIDQLTADATRVKSSNYEPVNYTYKVENACSDFAEGDSVIYQIRSTTPDILFKRRVDFSNDEVIIENFGDKRTSMLSTEKQMEVISLDSDSELEDGNTDERSLTFNSIVSNKGNIEENAKRNLEKNGNEIENPNSDSNCSANNNDKVDLLCKSIDSVLPEMTDLFNDMDVVSNDSTTNSSEKQMTNEKIDKVENSRANTENNASKLNTQDISKVLEIISSSSEYEIETIYDALQYINRTNSEQPKVPDSPPPAPPPITDNVTVPIQPCYPQQKQQQQQLIPCMNPCNNSNYNFPSTSASAPPKPKINVNDPRIKKQLQAINNSPILNFLDTSVTESIKQILREAPPQPSTLNSSKSNVVTDPKTAEGTSKSSITYGEYKRRQLQKKLEIERQREEERKAYLKAQKEREMRENSKQSQNTEKDIRSALLSTLSPCKEQLTSLWNEQKNSTNSSRENNNDKSKEKQQKENIKQKDDNCRIIQNSATSKPNVQQSKNKKSDQKLNRIYSELKCTFKGYDQIQDFIAEESINYSSEMTRDANISPTSENDVNPRYLGLRRRSSMYALSAITEQLNLQSSDSSDSENSEKSSRRRRRSFIYDSSSEGLSRDSFHSTSKNKRKNTNEVIRPNKRPKPLRVLDDETSSQESSSDGEERNTKMTERFEIKQPVIKLHRISNEFIRYHTKRHRRASDTENVIANQIDIQNVAVTKSVALQKTSERVENLQAPSKKMPKLKKYNNDCQMTERNTHFCVLCRCKPSDLTNHYKGRHKIESYVSRLNWSELEDLLVNTPFAKLHPNSKNYRFERYEVECPFCKEKLIDQFINLYNHYSVHTGEYAFQCSHCNLSRPYKPDIQSHMLHSKTCRNASVQVMYRYPPQAQCIYLHICNICNFVQLNEANILKHLREHHDLSKAIASNVQKCILAAISDGPDVNEPTLPAKTNEINSKIYDDDLPVKNEANVMHFKIDDDDIPVSNEPCLEEDENQHEEQTPKDSVLKKMLASPAIPLKFAQPMTVVHTNINNHHDPPPSQDLTAAQRHLPIIIKMETGDIDGRLNLTSAECTIQKNTVYEQFRNFPQNVNYLGLYKCMMDDCYYSTDCPDEIIKHLTGHSKDELSPNEYLQCPYCIISSDANLELPLTPIQVVEHISLQHGHLNFQCSMCCYRSCDASNVHIHQQIQHSSALNICKIYKLSIDDSYIIKRENLDLNKLISQNIFEIHCKLCNASFYHTQFLLNHLHKDHKQTNISELRIYSCIYCPFTLDNKNQLRIHMATKHPGELPLIYDHSIEINSINEDRTTSANVVDVSEPVPWIEEKPTKSTTTGTEENTLEDIKPNFQDLLFMNEETAKARLRKLTTHTGVAPDNLFRCAEPACGGFFSNFELWLRHMKVRHHTLECQCPHCTTSLLLPLEKFDMHFNQHRRHMFICFYCSTTFANELQAIEHASQMHNDVAEMRFENIRFNLNYSYSIMLQNDLFTEREQFIAELLIILDNRLKELENRDIQKLKKQWLVPDSSQWLDDYLQGLSYRKTARCCLVKDCTFRTLKEAHLYRHLSTSHTIAGTQFNCSKCDFQVKRCKNLDEVFDHIKLHNEYHFICSACSLVTSSRSKISAHIQAQHSGRDVPVIHVFRTSQGIYFKLCIIFADEQITFTTMKHCFCCSERNMNGDVFNLHLKRYHNFSLNYYCEKCTNFSFQSLKEVKPHFQQFHNLNKLKIRCEFSTLNDLHVLSLNNFQVQIVNPYPVSQQTAASLQVKDEPMDVSDSDNVILIEDDDIEIENSLKEEKQNQQKMPTLKCVSFTKLMQTTTASSLSTTAKIDVQPTLPVASSTSSTDYYKLGFQNINKKPVNTCQNLNQISAASASTNATYAVYNNAAMSSDPPNYNRTSTQSNSLPLYPNAPTMPAASAVKNATYSVYNNTPSSSDMPTYNRTSTQSNSLSLHPNAASAVTNVTYSVYNNTPSLSDMPTYNRTSTQSNSLSLHPNAASAVTNATYSVYNNTPSSSDMPNYNRTSTQSNSLLHPNAASAVTNATYSVYNNTRTSLDLPNYNRTSTQSNSLPLHSNPHKMPAASAVRNSAYSVYKNTSSSSDLPNYNRTSEQSNFLPLHPNGQRIPAASASTNATYSVYNNSSSDMSNYSRTSTQINSLPLHPNGQTIPATSALTNATYPVYNNTALEMSNYSRTSTQINSLALHPNEQINMNANTQNLPNNLCINQTNNIHNSTNFMVPQHYNYNKMQFQNPNSFG